MTASTSAFALPERLSAKADPVRIGDDERHFVLLRENLRSTIAELTASLEQERKGPGGSGQEALERDLEIHRLTARLRALRRFGLDLCLGRIVAADGSEPIYIGRFGLTDRDGTQLLVDWRSPAAEPFFGATLADPMGLVSRRRYRWTDGRITDYWDEAFTEGIERSLALDDESAFIASLGASRDVRMRDVLGTIQADQDAIIRAGSRGTLVVDGGPGTGKTVVALHRSAYLLYSDPRLQASRGGLLFVGPSRGYLSYIDDVLPSLGEDGAQTVTLRYLVPEGFHAVAETDQRVASLKSSARIVDSIEGAVRHYERPPTIELQVDTPWSEGTIGRSEWAEAFDAPDSGTPHNEARDQVWEALIDIVMDQIDDFDGAVPLAHVRRSLLRNEELASTFAAAWPLLDPVGIVADLWSVPAYLRQSAPWLTNEEVDLLQRADARAWTIPDLPFLDIARQRIGDPEATRRIHRREAAIAAEQVERDRVIDELIASDDSEMYLMWMLREQDFTNTLVDEAGLPSIDPDSLTGPFAHIVVDEAQELSDAEWQMLIRRCPSRSFTIVGDRAQARHGFTESWEERLHRIGLSDVTIASLSINYRTPEEVMAESEPVIRAVLPDANVPTSIRSSGIPVRRGKITELTAIVGEWLSSHEEGIGVLISTNPADLVLEPTPRVRILTPELSKGLEFDLVVLVEPESFGKGIQGAVDRYVAMTRATQQLVILTSN